MLKMEWEKEVKQMGECEVCGMKKEIGQGTVHVNN
jgi:hypothetical protein